MFLNKLNIKWILVWTIYLFYKGVSHVFDFLTMTPNFHLTKLPLHLVEIQCCFLLYFFFAMIPYNLVCIPLLTMIGCCLILFLSCFLLYNSSFFQSSKNYFSYIGTACIYSLYNIWWIYNPPINWWIIIILTLLPLECHLIN